MRPDERETLRRCFDFRCGYCGVSEKDVGAELTVDHYHPRSKGGLHDAENWVYCCHACNEFKADWWEIDTPRRILHPIRDDMAAHVLELDDGSLRALSETAVFHVERLHLNRLQLVAFRHERRLREAECRTQDHLVERLRNLEQQNQVLTAELARLERGDSNL